MLEKPPIGIIPKKIWIEQRINEIRRAVNEYINAGMRVNVEWIEEYNQLLKELKEV